MVSLLDFQSWSETALSHVFACNPEMTLPESQQSQIAMTDRKERRSISLSNGCRCLFVWIAFVCILVQAGCVRKRMTVRTQPAGAMVYIDKQPIGLSPVSSNFTYYGTRSIELVRDGYRTEKFLRRFNPPWYEIPPLDFLSESLWPYEKRDERIIDVQLTPELVVPNDALIQSGEQLRLQASQGIAVNPPPTIGISPPLNTNPNADPTIPRGPPPVPYLAPINP